MEQKIKILSFEDKKTKADKPYASFKTDSGWVNAFDKEVIDKLKECKLNDEIAHVEIVESKGFKNVKSVYGGESTWVDVSSEKGQEAMKRIAKERASPITVVPNNKFTPMYVSYAKDIFVAIQHKSELKQRNASEDMRTAIELVKQAKEAFDG